jgi:hypothetical protein
VTQKEGRTIVGAAPLAFCLSAGRLSALFGAWRSFLIDLPTQPAMTSIFVPFLAAIAWTHESRPSWSRTALSWFIGLVAHSGLPEVSYP